MTTPGPSSSPSPATTPAPVPDPNIDKTAGALAGGNPGVEAPKLELRQAVITAVDLAAATCSVAIGGDPTSVPNVHYLSNYKPTLNDSAWVLVNGPDILALDRDGKFGAAAFAGLGQSTAAGSATLNNSAYSSLGGPAVSTTIPASGRLLVCVSADVSSPYGAFTTTASFMSFQITGSSSLGASDGNALSASTYTYPAYQTDYQDGSGGGHSHSVSTSDSFSGSGSCSTGGSCSVSGSGSGSGSTGSGGGGGGHFHNIQAGSSNVEVAASRVTLLLGLTPGAATVTAMYRTSGGTGTWSGRSVWVLPL